MEALLVNVILLCRTLWGYLALSEWHWNGWPQRRWCTKSPGHNRGPEPTWSKLGTLMAGSVWRPLTLTSVNFHTQHQRPTGKQNTKRYFNLKDQTTKNYRCEIKLTFFSCFWYKDLRRCWLSVTFSVYLHTFDWVQLSHRNSTFF